MKKSIFLCLLLLLTCCAVSAFAVPPSNDYTLLLADEFCGDALDMSIWDYRSGTPYGGPNLPENVRVQDGLLHLDYLIRDGLYTGGGVLTTFNLPYGYYETRAKVFGETGALHTSFWLSGGSAFTAKHENLPQKNVIIEIDGFEIDSHTASRLSHGTIYWWNERKSMFRDAYTEKDFSKDYFVMGMEWLPDRVNFYVDGELINTDSTMSVYGPSYLWLTAVAMPDGREHLIEDEKVNGSSVFDYFRYYQKPLKNENLLGNGNFEYDRVSGSQYPFCYIVKGDTNASSTCRTQEAYEGMQCLQQASALPYSVSAGQEFRYLLNGKYTFSGKFKAKGTFTTARMVIYDRDGSVLAEKDIPASNDWISLSLKNIELDGYAYVAIESASDGGTNLLIDDLEFYTLEGEAYQAHNTPDYLLYDASPSALLSQMYDGHHYTFDDTTEHSDGWDASSLDIENYWGTKGDYAVWEIPVTSTDCYQLDVHCLYNANNADSMKYTVTRNEDTPTEYTVPIKTGETYWNNLSTLDLTEGDILTIRADCTHPGSSRISQLRLIPVSCYHAYNSLTFVPNDDSLLYQARVYDWGEKTPYREDGIYYLPCERLNRFFNLDLETETGYISSTALSESTPYRLIDLTDSVLITDTQEDFDTNFVPLCKAELKSVAETSAASVPTLAEDTATGAVVSKFADAYTVGNWQKTSLDSGSYYATGRAVAVWNLAAPQKGAYILQYRSIQHENSASGAKINAITEKQTKSYIINQKTAQTGWYDLGLYSLKANETLTVAVSNSTLTGCLRASAIRLVPVTASAPEYMGDADEKNATTVLFADAQTVGIWNYSSIGNTYTCNTADAKATYTVTAPKKGRYSVQIFSASHSNGPANGRITFESDSDFSIYSINQQTAQTGWFEVGNQEFMQGEAATVTIEKSGNGYLRTKAVRLVPIPAKSNLLQSGDDVILELGDSTLPCENILLGEYDKNGFLVDVKAAPSVSPAQFILNNPENSYKLFFWDKTFRPFNENK